ncbi:MAG: penicillin-binding protein activator, partial [Deinococcales bacterium]
MTRLSVLVKMFTTLLAGTLVILLVGCGAKPTVGVLLPMTGSAASYGVSMKEGIDLAIAEAKQGGTVLSGTQFIWGDSESNPDQGVQELRRLSKAGARIVILGTTSDTAKAILPVLKETDTLALSPSASAPSLTKDSRLFFRIFTSDELEGRRAARFLYDDQDRHSVLIYAQNSEQARGIEPPFRQVFEQAMGGTVVGKVSLENPDWKNESADLLTADHPESVYVIAYAKDTIEVLKQLREKNYDGTICLTSAFYSSQVVDKYPTLLEGVFFPQPAFDMQDERPLVQDFVKNFRAKYEHDPDIYAAHAYDAARVVLYVLQQAPAYDTSEL